MRCTILWMLLTALSAPAWGQDVLRLTIGESKVISVGSTRKVAVGNPAVADVTVVSDREILVTAKAPGSTNLLFVSPGGARRTRTITVTPYNLKRSMIELGVEIMEIDTSSAMRAGAAWASLTGAGNGVLPNGVAVNESGPDSVFRFGTFSRSPLEAHLQLLIDRGKARILAKPKLLAVSGEQASFLAGGEVPYVVENGIGNSRVEWKPYGVRLSVKPAADTEGNIRASLRAEVSGLDATNGVPIGNGDVVVPAMRTRWAETTVYMRGGTTLVIAGLMQNEEQKVTSGIPLLSDLPVLGEIFRSTHLRQRQTEVVIFVTPTLVGSSRNE
jgi:pilus assembly protein CpaC